MMGARGMTITTQGALMRKISIVLQLEQILPLCLAKVMFIAKLNLVILSQARYVICDHLHFVL